MIKTNFFKYSRDLYHIDLISSSLNRDKSSETIPCDLYLEMSSKGKVYWSTNITLVKEGSHIPLGRLDVKRTGSFDFVLINKKGIPFKDGEFNIRITLWKGRFVWLVLQTYFFLITGILMGLIGLFILIIDLYKNKKRFINSIEIIKLNNFLLMQKINMRHTKTDLFYYGYR